MSIGFICVQSSKCDCCSASVNRPSVVTDDKTNMIRDMSVLAAHYPNGVGE